jgi:hypothetical protein
MIHNKLFRPSDDPLVPVLDSSSLQSTDVAPRESFADCQCDILFAREHFWDHLGRERWRTVIQHGRETDDTPIHEAVESPSRAESCQLCVDDKLRGQNKTYRTVGSALRESYLMEVIKLFGLHESFHQCAAFEMLPRT